MSAAAPGVTADAVAQAALTGEVGFSSEEGAGKRSKSTSPMTGWLATVAEGTRFVCENRPSSEAIQVHWGKALSGVAKTGLRGLSADLWTDQGLPYPRVSFPRWFEFPGGPGALADYRTWRDVSVPAETKSLTDVERHEFVKAGARTRVEALLRPLVTVWLFSEGFMHCAICACCGLAGVVETDDKANGFPGRLPHLRGQFGTGMLSQMCTLLFRKEELKKPWNVRVCLLCSAARDCIHKGTLDLVPDPSILAIHPRLCLYDGYTRNSSDLTKSDVLVRPRRWERLEHQQAFFEMSCSPVTTLALKQLGMFEGERGWVSPHKAPWNVVWFWVHAYAGFEKRAAPWGYTRFVISRSVDSEPTTSAPEGEPVGSPPAAAAGSVDPPTVPPAVPTERREEKPEEPGTVGMVPVLDLLSVVHELVEHNMASEGLEEDAFSQQELQRRQRALGEEDALSNDGPSLTQPEGTPDRMDPADPTEIPDNAGRASEGGGGLGGGWPPLRPGSNPAGTGGSGTGGASGSGSGGDGRDDGDDRGRRNSDSALRAETPRSRIRRLRRQRHIELLMRLFGLLRFLFETSREQELDLQLNPATGDPMDIVDIVFNIPGYLASWGVPVELLPTEQETWEIMGENPSAGPNLTAMASFIQEVQAGGWPILQDPGYLDGVAPDWEVVESPSAPAAKARPPPVPPKAAPATRNPPPAEPVSAGPVAPAAPALPVNPAPALGAVASVPQPDPRDIALLPEEDPGFDDCPPETWLQMGFRFALAVIVPHTEPDGSFHTMPPEHHVYEDDTCPAVSAGPVMHASCQHDPGVGFGAGGMPLAGSALRPLWQLPPSSCPEGHTPIPRPAWARHPRPSKEWCWGCWSGLRRHWRTQLPVWAQKRLPTGGASAGYGLCEACNRFCGGQADQALRAGITAVWFLWRSLMDMKFRRNRDQLWLRETAGNLGQRNALSREMEKDRIYADDLATAKAASKGKGKDSSPPPGGQGSASAKDKGKGQGKGKGPSSTYGGEGKGAPLRLPSGAEARPFFGGSVDKGGKGKDASKDRSSHRHPSPSTDQWVLMNRHREAAGKDRIPWSPNMYTSTGALVSTRRQTQQAGTSRDRSRTPGVGIAAHPQGNAGTPQAYAGPFLTNVPQNAPRGAQVVRGTTPGAAPRPPSRPPQANPAAPRDASADPSGRHRSSSQQPRQGGPPGAGAGGPRRPNSGGGRGQSGK